MKFRLSQSLMVLSLALTSVTGFSTGLTVDATVYPSVKAQLLGFSDGALNIPVLAQIVMEPVLKMTRVPLTSEPINLRPARQRFDLKAQAALRATAAHLPVLLKPIYQCMEKGKAMRLPSIPELRSIYGAYECQKGEAQAVSVLLDQLNQSGPLYPATITEPFDRGYNKYVAGDYRQTLFKIPAQLSQENNKLRRILYINEYAPTSSLPAPIFALGFRAIYCEKITGRDVKYTCGVLLTPANQNMVR